MENKRKRPSPGRAGLSVSQFNPYKFMGCLCRDVGDFTLASLCDQEQDASMLGYDPPLNDVGDRYLLKEVLSKFPYRHLRVDTRKVAIEGFVATEKRIAGVNSELSTIREGNPRVYSVLCDCMRKIASSIRPFSSDDVVRAMELPKRATNCTPRKFSDRRLKVAVNHFTSTRRLSNWVQPLVEGTEWASVFARSHYSNSVEVDTVPKNARTDRTIGKEPTLNAAYQRGVGVKLQQRLLSVGVNLRDQSINRKLAHSGSLTGRLATIDLKDASASISSMLVLLTIPNWLLDQLWVARTDYASVEGELHPLEQWSGMGNGYTFELQSLIFWGLVQAIAAREGVPLNHDNFGIYGDDIICPVELVPAVLGTFSAVGLIVNTKKTHVSGGFRESCGGSYHHGRDITPFYVRPEFSGDRRPVATWNWIRVSKLWYQFYAYVKRLYPGYPVLDTGGLIFPLASAYLNMVCKESLLSRANVEDADGGFLYDDRAPSKGWALKSSVVTETLEGHFLLRAWQLMGRTSIDIENFPTREVLRWKRIRAPY